MDSNPFFQSSKPPLPLPVSHPDGSDRCVVMEMHNKNDELSQHPWPSPFFLKTLLFLPGEKNKPLAPLPGLSPGTDDQHPYDGPSELRREGSLSQYRHFPGNHPHPPEEI